MPRKQNLLVLKQEFHGVGTRPFFTRPLRKTARPCDDTPGDCQIFRPVLLLAGVNFVKQHLLMAAGGAIADAFNLKRLIFNAHGNVAAPFSGLIIIGGIEIIVAGDQLPDQNVLTLLRPQIPPAQRRPTRKVVMPYGHPDRIVCLVANLKPRLRTRKHCKKADKKEYENGKPMRHNETRRNIWNALAMGASIAPMRDFSQPLCSRR